MEVKKNKKYDLEHKRPVFFGIGMIVSLSLTLLAFEWKSPIDPVVVITPTEEIPWFVMEEPEVTKHELPKLPKPQVKKQVISPSSIIKETKELIENISDDPVEDIDDLVDDIIEKSPTKVETPSEPFIVVEDMPQFEGGDAALLNFISKNIKYPKQAQRMGVEGRVYLSFVVDIDGSVSNIEIIKGIGAGCDAEAKRVIALLPAFTPGKQRGVPVRVKMQLPVNFTLR